MRHTKDRRRPRLADRVLFGPCTCRNGLCDGDATALVELPAVQYSGPNYGEVQAWVGVWYCDQCAARELAAK